MARAYAALIRRLWLGDRGSVSPTELKSRLSRHAPRFAGYEQARGALGVNRGRREGRRPGRVAL